MTQVEAGDPLPHERAGDLGGLIVRQMTQITGDAAFQLRRIRTGVEQASAPQPAALASGSRGDLQLLRRDPWLRVRCAGAAVLIFLIYTTVIIVLGRGDVYLIGVWIPTVLAGVVVGALLDRSHRALTGTSSGGSGGSGGAGRSGGSGQGD